MVEPTPIEEKLETGKPDAPAADDASANIEKFLDARAPVPTNRRVNPTNRIAGEPDAKVRKAAEESADTAARSLSEFVSPEEK